MPTKTETAKKQDKKPVSCNCFSQVNKSLEEQGVNTRLLPGLQMSFETGRSRVLPSLATEKADSKKREPQKTIICAYCPFCGKKFPDFH